ncbi:hypothetical protein NEPAR06_1036 [Nematocida parisii]|nr:hypothetical protein NEPAR06_1036 [Nematocida parisii]KAI5157399.1 hypothetical protein NEPAR05_1247 [Nematocida parisii]
MMHGCDSSKLGVMKVLSSCFFVLIHIIGVYSVGDEGKMDFHGVKEFLIKSSKKDDPIKNANIKVDMANNGIVFGDKTQVLYIDLCIPLSQNVRNTLEEYPILNDEIVIHTRDTIKVNIEKVNFILENFKAKRVSFTNILIHNKIIGKKKALAIPVQRKIADNITRLSFYGMSTNNIENILLNWEVPSLVSLSLEKVNITSMSFFDNYLSGVELKTIRMEDLKDLVLIKSMLLKSPALESITLKNIPYIDSVGYEFLKRILKNVKIYILLDAWLFEKINLKPQENIMNVDTLVISLPSVSRISNTINLYSKKINHPTHTKGVIKARRVEVNGILHIYSAKDAAFIITEWLNIFIIDAVSIQIIFLCDELNSIYHNHLRILRDESQQLLPIETIFGNILEWYGCNSIINAVNPISINNINDERMARIDRIINHTLRI